MKIAIQPTKEQLAAGIQMIKAIADALRELKRVPSGHFYARIMDKIDLASYEKILGILTGAGLIKIENHEIIWLSPEKEGGE